jgi:predicted TIM-barrel fold metal-dependent hydrolase
VHTVGGTGLRNWGAVPGWPLLEELSWPESANGALMPLFLGGVLEHHPRLRVVLADQGTRRIADIVRAWESTYQSSQFNSYGLERSPWEYWTRQCFVAPAPFRRSDCELREVLGVSQMMWSSRYPQTVGGWIDVRSSLCHVLAGVPEREMRAIVGGNAVRLYSLDSGALSEVAARIGVESEDLSMTAA